MMNQPKKDRRAFLKGAAVTTAAIGTGATATGVLADTQAPPKEVTRTGYQETEHVRAYYQLARQ